MIKTSALTAQLDRQRLVDLTTYLVATSAVKCVVKKIENECVTNGDTISKKYAEAFEVVKLSNAFIF